MRIVVASLLAGTAVMSGISLAQADTRGVYSTPDGEFTIEYRDNDHIRFALPDGGFFLVTGGEGYALSRGSDGWMAVSADDIRQLMDAEESTEQVRVTPLGGRETVAGIAGERYRVEVGDEWADDWRDDGEVVLADDPRVRDMGRALRRMASLFGDANDQAALNEADGIDLDRYGLLESDDMRLSSISSERFADRIFQLPPNVSHQQLPRGAAASGGEGRGRGESAREPGWLERQMQGTGGDARDEAAGETRREVRDSVREGVRSLFE